jgi:rhodanese-related sulfurtransferase
VPQKRNVRNSTAFVYKKKQRRKVNKQNKLWNWIGPVFAAVAIIVVVILFIPKFTGVPHISVSEAYQKYQQGAFFLDVRSQAEWDQAHIANSTLLPLDELHNRLADLPKGQDIVVVCLTGHRSEEAVTILRKARFSQATCMTGGLTAWIAAGYPLVGSNP